jgi:hypothetical protein
MAHRTIALSIMLAITTTLPARRAMAGYPHFEKHHADGDDDAASHYSDSGAHPTKAQRLGITLQARALLNKDGSTDFELTTGQLDSAALAPGRIAKVEISLPEVRGERRENEKKEWEAEYSHLRNGGYFHTVLAGREHNQTLNIRARIRGIHPAKGGRDNEGEDDVEIFLQTVVKFRPDLAVTNFEYPNVAQPNTVVVFSATVAEQKGDVGEHSDCVLLVDGQKVDDMKGPIWVDAAGTVTCRFAYSFATSGLHTVAAVLQNGVPADADSSNNTLSGQILIRDLARIFYSATVAETKIVTDSAVDAYFTSSSTVPDSHTATHNTSVQQARHFFGSIPSAVNMPLARVSYVDSSDGAQLSSLALMNLAADFTAVPRNPLYTTESCVQRTDSNSGSWLSVCRYLNENTGAGTTTVSVTWDAGAATYHSDGYCHSVVGGYHCTGGDFTRNSSSASGTLVTFGAKYAADIVVDDGTAYQAHPAMTLQLQVETETPPPTCNPATFPPNTTPGKRCYSFAANMQMRSGADSLRQ